MGKILNKSLSEESLGAIFIFVFGSIFSLIDINHGFSWPIFLAFGIASLAISLRNPLSGILASVPLTIFFERFFTLQSFWINRIEYKLYPIDILLVGIFVGILINWKRMIGNRRLKLEKGEWGLLLFILWNILYFLSSLLMSSSEKSLALSSLKNYAFYPLIFFAIKITVPNRERLKQLFSFFAISSLGIMFFIFLGLLQGQGIWSEFTPLSTSGVRTLAFTHGLYASILFIIGWLYLITRKSDWRWKNILLGILLILGIGILGSLMRHLWISLAISLGLIFFLFGKEERLRSYANIRKVIFVVFLLILIFFYLANLFPDSSINQLYSNSLGTIGKRSSSLISTSEDESFSWRGLVWKAGFLEFWKDPILGMGTGKRIYVEKEFYQDFIEVKNIHNSYLAILFQLGIAGFLFFIYFLFERLKLLFQIAKKRKDFYSLSILGVLLLFLPSIPFQPYLETNMLSLFFWMFLGLISSLKKKEKK